jgi:hypothetical protein
LPGHNEHFDEQLPIPHVMAGVGPEPHMPPAEVSRWRRGGDDRGAIGYGLAVAVVAGVGFVAAMPGVVAYNLKLREEADLAKSKIQAESIHLEPEHIDLRATRVISVKGSKLATGMVVNLPLTSVKFGVAGTAHRATLKEGKIVLRTGLNCATPPEMVDGPVTEDRGRRVHRKVVKIPMSCIVYDTQMPAEDLEIIDETPPLDQLVKTPLNTMNAAHALLCQAALTKSEEKCNSLRFFTNWDESKQALLRRALQVKAIEAARRCGPDGWGDEQLAILDEFRDQAKGQGFNPALVDVVFVGENGTPSGAPDYTKDTLDGLREKGILTKKDAEFQQYEDVSVDCFFGKHPYEPKYPNNLPAPVPTEELNTKPSPESTPTETSVPAQAFVAAREAKEAA